MRSKFHYRWFFALDALRTDPLPSHFADRSLSCIRLVLSQIILCFIAILQVFQPALANSSNLNRPIAEIRSGPALLTMRPLSNPEQASTDSNLPLGEEPIRTGKVTTSSPPSSGTGTTTVQPNTNQSANHESQPVSPEPTWSPPTNPDSTVSHHQSGQVQTSPAPSTNQNPAVSPPSRKRMGLAIAGTAVAGTGLILFGAAAISLQTSTKGDLASGLAAGMAVVLGSTMLISGGIMAIVGWIRYAKHAKKHSKKLPSARTSQSANRPN